MKLLYRIYQLFVAVPLVVLITIFFSLLTMVGCALGDSKYWGFVPLQYWCRMVLALFFLPAKSEGHEHLDKNQSYVFVPNHQGAFDIFLIYSCLRHNIRWMMKYQLRKIPFVGRACVSSNQVFLDKRGPKRIRESYEKARGILKDGVSLVVFPEGARTFTGHMGKFKKGAFTLADELQMPVVPVTINGSFHVMPRMRDWHFVCRHPLSLTIHKPIYPIGKGEENIAYVMKESYEAVMSALEPDFQGFYENPDQ